MLAILSRVDSMERELFSDKIYQCRIIRYEGEFRGDLPHGTGKEIIQKQGLYEGEFKNGMKHGKGVLKFFNGAVYQGLFKKNFFEGYGVFSDQG